MKKIIAILVLIPFIAWSANPFLSVATKKGAPAGSPSPDVLWWRLNDGSGTTIAGTSSAGGDSGTTDAAWVTGKSGAGYALDFIPANADNAVSDIPIVFGANVITVCAWVYPDVITGGPFVLWESGTKWDSGNNQFLVYIQNSVLQIAFGGVVGTVLNKSRTAPPAGVWVHVMIVFDGSTALGSVKVYFDGVLQGLTTGTNNRNTTANIGTATLNVGSRNAASLYFDGRIDDLRIYASDKSADVSAISADAQ